MRTNQRIDASELSWGLILITVGVVFLLDRLDIADFHYVIHHFWPMILVVLGVSKLFNARTVWNGCWLIAVGVWLQISALHLFGMTYGDSWPLLLIAAGICVIGRALFGVARSRTIDTTSDTPTSSIPTDSTPPQEAHHE
jgi:hypothetical protein